MGIEIERKYLVNSVLWEKITPQSSIAIRQAYLHSDPDKTLRVRIKGNQGFLTIKGKNEGLSRLEFEYEIPVEDANQLIEKFGNQCIDKIRHYVPYKNKLWEVDVFSGLNQGLIIAEIELSTEAEEFELPEWILDEVTSDYRYSNSNLAKNPYTSWK